MNQTFETDLGLSLWSVGMVSFQHNISGSGGVREGSGSHSSSFFSLGVMVGDPCGLQGREPRDPDLTIQTG